MLCRSLFLVSGSFTRSGKSGRSRSKSPAGTPRNWMSRTLSPSKLLVDVGEAIRATSVADGSKLAGESASEVCGKLGALAGGCCANTIGGKAITHRDTHNHLHTSALAVAFKPFPRSEMDELCLSQRALGDASSWRSR